MEAGAFGQPVVNQLGLVCSVVVHDEVNVQFFGHVLLDGVEEVAELLGAMALLVLADDLAGLGIQRGWWFRAAYSRGCGALSAQVPWVTVERCGQAPVSGSFHLRTEPARAPEDSYKAPRCRVPCR
jgi:hypothetical protein